MGQENKDVELNDQELQEVSGGAAIAFTCTARGGDLINGVCICRRTKKPAPAKGQCV